MLDESDQDTAIKRTVFSCIDGYKVATVDESDEGRARPGEVVDDAPKHGGRVQFVRTARPEFIDCDWLVPSEPPLSTKTPLIFRQF